jgi:hypothetical protein
VAVAVTMAVTLTQVYENQKTLLGLVALFVALEPPSERESAASRASHPVAWLLRAQLFVVYLFSAGNKLESGFASGEVLSNTLAQVLAMPSGALVPRAVVEALAAPGVARAASVAVLAAELALPLVLLARPWWGVAGVVALHVGFSLVMPGVWAFTLVMIALAWLFTDQCGRNWRTSGEISKSSSASSSRTRR